MAEDWKKHKRTFITDAQKPSLRAFARVIGVSPTTVQGNAKPGNWLAEREQYWTKVEQKSADHVIDYQVHEIVRETSQRLDEIRKMQKVALEAAGGGPNGELVRYEKPHEAVNAYEKLVKLERLLTEQSTENVSVSDGRAAVAQLFTILREEVRDVATLERIAGRLSELDGAISRVSPPADSLN